ncbi:hypothetical protein M758_7G072300 [Ceratodon purpureus]|nr:hypothetical protein M758_7G072300 [Ceratodon purpureus]
MLLIFSCGALLITMNRILNSALPFPKQISYFPVYQYTNLHSCSTSLPSSMATHQSHSASCSASLRSAHRN